MEIKAAVVFEQSGKFCIEPLEISEPNEDEVLVRAGGSRRGGAGGCGLILRPITRPSAFEGEIREARAIRNVSCAHTGLAGTYPG